MKSNWYVLTGGPSTGKTTLLEELRNLGWATVPEAARGVVDEGIAKGLSVDKIRKDERQFQQQVLQRKVLAEKQQPSETKIFFDRGMHDTIAYYRYYGYPVDKSLEQVMRRSQYQKVFLLEPFSTFTEDYVRIEADDFRKRIQKLLLDAYMEYGMTPVVVPATSTGKRVQFILQNLN